jgi:ribosomal protein L37AE/L43A
MPDRDVRTIQDIIFYEYAKIIAKSAFKVPDDTAAKKQHYGFIKKTFRELQSGVKSWSEITREDKQFVVTEQKCIYCGSQDNLQWEHIVPRSIKIKPECSNCDKIQGIHNQIWACKTCNSQKGTMGLYEFYKSKYPDETKFYDRIPALLEKKYLKTIYNCHECSGTLNKEDLDSDRIIIVLDIDAILRMAS